MTVIDPAPHRQTRPRGTAAGDRAVATDIARNETQGGDETAPLATRPRVEPYADHARMRLWEGQLRSIQQLGQRLATLTTVREIGQAICNEIRELVRSHNVRVYRVHGDEVVAVAWRGEIGEYADEVGE